MKLIELNLGAPPPEKKKSMIDTAKTPQEIVLESGHKESTSPLGGGANESMVVKIKEDGSVVFKPYEGEHSELKEYVQYKRERAAYLVSRFLGFDFVPVTVIKEIDNRIGSAQQFVEDILMEYNLQDFDRDFFLSPNRHVELNKLNIFDYIIANGDRHLGNYLYKDRRVVAIDHGLAFRDNESSSAYCPSFDVPVDIGVRLIAFMKNREQSVLLRDLLLELLPVKDVDDFFNRLQKLINTIRVAVEA